ncbi:uncharacterized protein LOC18429531 [Amborella trichopoda]|uniref:RRM domain-containing protein n=1 Tax=Amborella trichopoda TaxID=13333 RepID=W1P1C3_AMBTC|nr:uncharacterized protein LOC18429531 [Amborella trichopoda]XP_011621608.1 uncharacterized protein LOC18429531 [Amborella trichopoda]ERN01449.1 hypothetical protein AMTR_s00002p00267480 [Amborella trichopoda]|eukprot:XP_006838880.1 uncharacterized protein LOC18429531 [Amborella trichopoda]
MGTTSTSQKDYDAFQEKVKRTVFVDNLSSDITISVLTKALGQFGKVINADFLPNYTESKLKDDTQCALVEMENEKQAKSIVTELSSFYFMIGGMPRPVRARLAKAEMFSERPCPPKRKILIRWVPPSEPDFMVAEKLKHLTKRHAAEASLLLKYQSDEETKLAEHQAETLKMSSKKYDMIDGIILDGTLSRLGRHYNMKTVDG